MAKTRERAVGVQGIIADNVRRPRKAKGVSREALADICGQHRTYICGIERSERNVTITTLEALAGALGVEPHRLLLKSAAAEGVAQGSYKNHFL